MDLLGDRERSNDYSPDYATADPNKTVILIKDMYRCLVFNGPTAHQPEDVLMHIQILVEIGGACRSREGDALTPNPGLP